MREFKEVGESERIIEIEEIRKRNEGYKKIKPKTDRTYDEHVLFITNMFLQQV